MIATEVPATFDNFDERGYLLANHDVRRAVVSGSLKSGHQHFVGIGHKEKRNLVQVGAIAELRNLKNAAIEPILKHSENIRYTDHRGFDFLPSELAAAAGIEPTDAISEHDYDPIIKARVLAETDKFFLDAGAGYRHVYYRNVVNVEVVPYPTTDVLSVLEHLPFKDNVFDYVICNAVLEHVRDPFSAASEICRVLKPGGEMFVIVPFLQPYHGYPHHYYNMTKSGLQNLFKDRIEVVSHTVPSYFHPAWVVSWIFNSWARGLTERDQKELSSMTVQQFMDFKMSDMEKSFVSSLSEEKRFELASGTFLVGRKR